MGYLRRTLQVRIPIDMAMDSHTPATEYGCWEERLVRDQCIHNFIFFNPNIPKKWSHGMRTYPLHAMRPREMVATTSKKRLF